MIEDVKKHLHDVCKVGQGANCCKYVTAGADGIQCAKINPADKGLIDREWATREHVAQGDNCEGVDLIALDKKES